MTAQSIISKRVMTLKPSQTLAISARAKALQQAGRDICSLSAGEPDFDTPEFIVEAATKALRDGITRYGPAAGDPELREAIAEKLTNTNQIPTNKEEVLVTNGGKQAIYNLFQVLLNQGDEVIIPSPYWLSYPEIAKLAGGKPIAIPSSPEDGFKLNLNALESAINPKSRLIILNSPGNPTGRVVPINELKALAEILRRNPNIQVMTDEIYEYLLAENEKHTSLAAIATDIKDRIFTVNGFAKGWAMTGWRVGYLAGNQEIIKVATALQSQSTSNVCSFAQRGALAALLGPKICIEEMSTTYNYRRKLLFDGLKEISGITLKEQKGAFYAFPQLPIGNQDSISFCKLALEKVGLAMIPGTPFGEETCMRLSCAASNETINDGLKRLKLLFNSLY